MKKLLISLFAGSALFVTGTIKAVAADLGFGVTAAIVALEADGTETETGSQTAETTNASVKNTIPVGEIFAEVRDIGLGMGTLSLGISVIPAAHDVSDNVKIRNDTETSVTGTATTVATARAQKAQAEVADHMMYYLEFKPRDSLFFKLGYLDADLNTTESLATGSSYGNASLNGILYGVGFQKDLNRGFAKFEVTFSDYDTINLTDSTGRTGVSTNNKISANLDATQIRLSYGF